MKAAGAKQTVIYALMEPDGREVRYIGKTSSEPEQRLNKHLSAAKHNNGSHLLHWLNSLLSKGQRPKVRILEVVRHGDDWREREKKWISIGRAKGWPLTNTTDGGEGLQNPSPSVRKKLADAARGKTYAAGKRTDAFRKRMAEVAKVTRNAAGHEVSEETRQKISKSLKGRTEHVPRGEANGLSKLTEKQVVQIRRKHAKGGVSMRALGREYGVAHDTIRKIIHNQAWKHAGV